MSMTPMDFRTAAKSLNSFSLKAVLEHKLSKEVIKKSDRPLSEFFFVSLSFFLTKVVIFVFKGPVRHKVKK